MKQPLKDNWGKIIGWTDEQGNRTWLTDENGTRLGYYDENYNQTFDQNGRKVGDGNILGTLL